MTNPALAFTVSDPLLDLLEREFDERHLLSFLELGDDALPPKLWESALLGPAREILGRPGKEFRRNLVEFAWRVSGGASPAPVGLSLLVEILHGGSLVIDDIEDGSAYRRGKPALHTMYGVPTALNTGNWLYFWPFALLSRLGLPGDDELALQRELARTLMACHSGQALDLSIRVTDLSQQEIPLVVKVSTQLKTGSLMGLAARLGARAAGADSERVEALSVFGRAFGVGLQMLDDLGGLVTQRDRHKGHQDLRLARLTWPWAWLAHSVDRLAFQKLRTLGQAVQDHLEHPEALAIEMRNALGDRGKHEIARHLRMAFHRVAQTLGDSPLLKDLEREVERLRQSYVS